MTLPEPDMAKPVVSLGLATDIACLLLCSQESPEAIRGVRVVVLVSENSPEFCHSAVANGLRYGSAVQAQSHASMQFGSLVLPEPSLEHGHGDQANGSCIQVTTVRHYRESLLHNCDCVVGLADV